MWKEELPEEVGTGVRCAAD